MLQRLYINGITVPKLRTAFKAANGEGTGDVGVILCPNTVE
jgi:hypothetical protein